MNAGTASRLRTRHKEAKLVYIKLNIQTPCPPRGAVPVHQGCCSELISTHNIQFAFGHGCDCPSYVNFMLNQFNFASTDLTASDAAGNSMTTNISVIQSSVTLTIDPISSGQLNQSSANVTGTVSDTNEIVMVNGVTATVNSDGTWNANNVPVSPTGSAPLTAQAYPGDPNVTPPDGGQQLVQEQPAQVVLASYYAGSYDLENVHYMDLDITQGDGTITHVSQDCWMHWLFTDFSHWTGNGGGASRRHDEVPNNVIFCGYGYNVTDTAGSPDPDYFVEENYSYADSGTSAGVYNDPDPWNSYSYAVAKVALDTGGAGEVGTTRTYAVQATMWEDGYGGLPPEWFNIAGKTLTTVATNFDGTLLGQAIITIPAGGDECRRDAIAAIHFGRLQFQCACAGNKTQTLRHHQWNGH